MRVLLIGKGHLGTYLAKMMEGSDRQSVIHWTEDLAALSSSKIAEFFPGIVVNVAGKTDLGWCERNQQECWRCNVVEPLMLQRRLPRSVPFVHFSSGCVWDGPFKPDGQPFGPADPPSPGCFYAWTKAACDSMLMSEARESQRPLLIARPRQVFSSIDSPRNTLSKLLKYESLIDTPNSMTAAFTIYLFLQRICLENPSLISRLHPRTCCVYNLGVASPYLVGKKLHEAGLRDEPKVITKRDLDVFLSPKRVDVVMRDEWFETYFSPCDVGFSLDQSIKDFSKTLSSE